MLVLTYHSISDGPAPLCVSSERFADQLDFLVGIGLEAISLGELRARMQREGRPPGNCFAITFDDGYRDFRENALPVLEARKLPATLFSLPPRDSARVAQSGHAPYTVPGGTQDPVLGPDELRDVVARGVEIGGHSVSHCDLTQLDDEAIERELQESCEILESFSGRAIESFAYPFGSFDARLRSAAGRYFRSAYTTQLAAIPVDADVLAMPRIDAFYLDSPTLRRAIEAGHPEPYLTARRWLRCLRGSEPRRALARANPLAGC